MSKRLYVTSLVQAHNCSHQYKLKLAGFEPLPPSQSLLAGLTFENAVKAFLPRSETTAAQAVAAANEHNLPENTLSFITFALEKLPPTLQKAEKVSFSVFAEREIEGITLAGYIDMVADDNIYELKYTQKYVNEVQKTHLFQLQHYMYLMDKEDATIVYACDTKKPSVRAFKVSRWSKRKYLALLQVLGSRYKEDAPLGLLHDWLCGYCAFSHVCDYFAEKDKLDLVYES